MQEILDTALPLPIGDRRRGAYEGDSMKCSDRIRQGSSIAEEHLMVKRGGDRVVFT